MRTVTYEGDYGYHVIDGQRFRKDQPVEVSDALAAKAEASDEKFKVSGTDSPKKQDD